MTAPPAPPAGALDAADLVSMPEPARPSARRARAALEAPPAAQAESAPPFTMDAAPKRRGGHKRTKPELERRVRELETERAALVGERPPELAATEASLRPALGGTFGAVFGIVATQRGPHWQLDGAEREALADAWAPVLAPFVGDAAESLPWLAAAGVTYHIVAQRVAVDATRRPSELVIPPEPVPSGEHNVRSPVADRPPRPSAAPGSRPLERTGAAPAGFTRPLEAPGYVPPAEAH